MRIRALVVDDHILVRQGIVDILESDRDFEVVGEASDGVTALAKSRELRPNVVLTDLYMPGLDGIELTRVLRQESPDTHVVLVTASPKEEDIIEAVQAGARGYIPKSTDAGTLLRQVKQAVNGGVALSPKITTQLVSALAAKSRERNGGQSAPKVALTERQRQVLALITQGKTNREIAAELHVFMDTVRAHVRTLMQKLNLDNRTQLALYGLRNGFGAKANGDRARTGEPLLGERTAQYVMADKSRVEVN